MNLSEDTWTTACAHILTSPTAQAVDVAACREVMARSQRWAGGIPEVTWPLAVAVVGVAAAAAYGLPRIIRILRG